MSSLSINGRGVGDGHPVFITFEAGPTHQGVESAKRLASCAAEAGGSAIKFQIIDADRLCSDRKQTISYRSLVNRETGETQEVTESLHEILTRRMLSKDEWRDVKRHCDSLGLAFFATVGFEDEVDFMQDLGCHSIKIASSDVTHHPLIEYAAKSGLSIQLDTGNATLGEIENAVDLIVRSGNDKIIIHHCPSGYPARLESIDLNVITTLRQMFSHPIAFSDHTPGWEMDIAAVSLGVNLIEKTITEDRTTPSIEHIMSVEPHEAAEFVAAIRDLETALGRNRRPQDLEEKRKKMANRRSAFPARTLPAGHVLEESDIIYRRPGFGLGPQDIPYYVGRKLAADMDENTFFSPDSFA